MNIEVSTVSVLIEAGVIIWMVRFFYKLYKVLKETNVYLKDLKEKLEGKKT